jgi:transcriptional regulator with XRE-family HTH domain
MTPDQVRMARASLNWSLERLAEASGIHRNTISNFEVSKYAGDTKTLAAIRSALEAAGVIFGEDADASVQLRRFQVGDRVRLRPQSRVGLNFQPFLTPKDTGEVIEVEGHPPQTGPTYRMTVRFPGYRVVHGAFKFEFELLKPAQPSREKATRNK